MLKLNRYPTQVEWRCALPTPPALALMLFSLKLNHNILIALNHRESPFSPIFDLATATARPDTAHSADDHREV